MSPRVMVDYDHPPGPNEPTEMDVPYSDLSSEMVFAMALDGDQGAIDYLNGQDDPSGTRAVEDIETRHRGPGGHLPMQTGHVGSSAERKRAARKAAVAADQDALMPQWETALSGLFDQQKQATLSRLTGKRGRQMLRRAAPPPSTPEGTPPAGPPPSIDPAQVFDQAFWTQKMLGVLQPMYLGIGATGRAQVLGQLGLSDTPPNESVAASAVNALLDQRANLLSGQVTDTTFRQIVEALQAGVADGEGIEALAKRVEAVFSDASRNRARTIARTEVVGAMNQVANAYANGLPAGVVGAHEWLAHHDERTRPTHRAADGQVRPLDQPFYVGGFPMMHPGDPTAPPGETIGCRCAVAYLPSNEATARLVGPSAVA